MRRPGQPICIVMADDDEDDRDATREAFSRHPLLADLRCVRDGRELLDFLHRRSAFADAPRPGLILLDLNMPRVDGREALRAIKGDPALRTIPVVVLTTSDHEEDVLASYDLGANSFITKPTNFTEFVRTVGEIGHYWLHVVELPGHN